MKRNETAAATVWAGHFQVHTGGRGTLDITDEASSRIAESGVTTGLCQVFLAHTSASLLITENADPTVRRDLEAWLQRAVPDGDAIYRHTAEGPDDMPAHVRSALLGTSVSVPVRRGRLALGTWQGLYLFEHRTAPHVRTVHVTVIGE
ncbi:MAG: secondary thiamine-phosphate synthase enzyme YjbQ [Planctomycetes bacterium]|nr:secondary thiamine-phosphate synthase enzyme YjbQ [Planctomycetota bacterium]